MHKVKFRKVFFVSLKSAVGDFIVDRTGVWNLLFMMMKEFQHVLGCEILFRCLYISQLKLPSEGI